MYIQRRIVQHKARSKKGHERTQGHVYGWLMVACWKPIAPFFFRPEFQKKKKRLIILG